MRRLRRMQKAVIRKILDKSGRTAYTILGMKNVPDK